MSEKYMNDTETMQKEINDMVIFLPNSKTGEKYEHVLNINNLDFISEYWIEGMENTGLTISNTDEPENQISPEKTDSPEENVPEQSQENKNSSIATDDKGIDEKNSDTRTEISNPESHTSSNITNSQEKPIVTGSANRKILITGTPKQDGFFGIIIKFRCRKNSEEKILERKINFIINPDPRSLWKNIPTNPNIKFYKVDSTCEIVSVKDETNGLKNLVAASKRGRSHAHEGRPRDDDFKIFYNKENQWYIIAVADGAGSAKYSRKGSEITCNTSLDFCKQKLSEPTELENAIKLFNDSEDKDSSKKTLANILYYLIGGAVRKVYKTIEDAATENKDEIKDYSTTFLLTICKKFSFGWFVASFWVGDGAICIYDNNRSYFKLLGTPDSGEYAGQTRFLTMRDIITPESIMSRLRCTIEHDFTALFLMTDGISDPYFETDANLNKIEKWNNFWKTMSEHVDFSGKSSEPHEQLLEWLDFWSVGNHDDRTIAILY